MKNIAIVSCAVVVTTLVFPQLFLASIAGLLGAPESALRSLPSAPGGLKALVGICIVVSTWILALGLIFDNQQTT